MIMLGIVYLLVVQSRKNSQSKRLEEVGKKKEEVRGRETDGEFYGEQFIRGVFCREFLYTEFFYSEV